MFGRDAGYPHFRGLHVEAWTSPIVPHYASADIVNDHRKTAETVDTIWEQIEAAGISGSTVAAALGSRKAGRPGPDAPASAAQIAMTVAAQSYSVREAFLNSVDYSGYARYSLFIMESVPRRESYRNVAAHDAVEALRLIVDTAEYGSRGARRGPDPFDVALYEVTPHGRKQHYTPMVWSGASAISHLDLPEGLRTELAAEGVTVPSTVSLTGARAALNARTAQPPAHGDSFSL